MEPIQTMSDEQFTCLREKNLSMISTFFDGTLLVRDPDGDLWEMSRKATLLPHQPAPRNRITPDQLTKEP